MKIVPVVNAILVTSALYLLVFERDRLLSFAGQDAPAPEELAAPATEAPAVAVQVLASKAKPVDQGVLARGQTEAARRVEVRAETSGSVITPPLRKGSTVGAGDILCQIDQGTRAASLLESEAKLAEARLNANAAEKLQQGGYRSDSAAAAAQAGLQEAEANVQAARKEIERTTMIAPFAGILDDDSAELGALLTAGSLCATVIALDPIKLVGFVPETELDRIEIGALVGARLATGREIAGQVTYASRSADPQTRTFRVEAALPNPDLSIREGQTVEMIIRAQGTNGHLLPASALTLNDNGALGVRIAVDGVARFAPVSLLRDTREGVWITGLPDAAGVIVVGQDYVTDGTPITTHPAQDVPGFGETAQ